MEKLNFHFQMLRNCANLEKILVSIDDESDFYKVFSARINFDENEDSAALEQVFERITKRQQSEPSTLLLDW